MNDTPDFPGQPESLAFYPDPDDCVIDVRPKPRAINPSESLFIYEEFVGTNPPTGGTRFTVTVPRNNAIEIFDGFGKPAPLNGNGSHKEHMQENQTYTIDLVWTVNASDEAVPALKVFLGAAPGALTELYNKTSRHSGKPHPFSKFEQPQLARSGSSAPGQGWKLKTKSRNVQMDLYLITKA